MRAFSLRPGRYTPQPSVKLVRKFLVPILYQPYSGCSQSLMRIRSSAETKLCKYNGFWSGLSAKMTVGAAFGYTGDLEKELTDE